jgi:hypothetical protein
MTPINKKNFALYEQVVLTEQMPADRIPAFLEEPGIRRLIQGTMATSSA